MTVCHILFQNVKDRICLDVFFGLNEMDWGDSGGLDFTSCESMHVDGLRAAENVLCGGGTRGRIRSHQLDFRGLERKPSKVSPDP